MFGEDDTDSPRLSSPWEAFSSSPSPCPGLASSLSSSVSSSDIEAELARRLQTEVPRLVPEIEEGNVEYKLKLSPSPERLTRLVTQLKWRLLEGGGQALYEIGVGDNGQLIGLTRGEMEGSLDALEKMAGELGATVMILREIVVPRAVVDRAKGDPDPGMLLMPDISRSSSASRSGSGSGDDELEAFSLDLEDDVKPATWTPQAPLTDPKAKLNRRNKSATKAEHKKVRRAVKKRVNAAFATKPPKMLRLEAFDTAVPVGLGVPDIAFPGVVIDNSVDTVPFEPTPRPVPCDDPDEVIIVEALVVRKLALEEAFLDFGGFSVLG